MSCIGAGQEDPMVERRGTSWQQGLWGGVVAGIIAGAVLEAVLVLATSARGDDVWGAMKSAGTPLLGERAAQPGFDAVAVAVGLLQRSAHRIPKTFRGVRPSARRRNR